MVGVSKYLTGMTTCADKIIDVSVPTMMYTFLFFCLYAWSLAVVGSRIRIVCRYLHSY